MILHVDMDAFYASVEERDRPELAGKPLVVGGSRTGRGVVAAANYAARRYGIHSAMPTVQAFRACPDLVSIPPRINYYAAISRQIREIFYRFTPLVEPLSLDEAFLDVAGCDKLFGSGPEIGRQIKSAIFRETGLVASVGVAPNKFVAKIASDIGKPNGFVIVKPEEVQEFLDPLPVGRIWGVGKVTESLFNKVRLRTIGDLRRVELDHLTRCFGSHAEHYYNLARGRDERKVIPDREAKSISHERTFEFDLLDRDVLRARARDLTDQVMRRLRRHKIRGRAIHLKVRFANFQTVTRSRTFSQPVDGTSEAWLAVEELLAAAVPRQHAGIRLLGVGLSQLEQGKQTQLSLFDSQSDRKEKRLDAVADEIERKFGAGALSRGSGIIFASGRKGQAAGD